MTEMEKTNEKNGILGRISLNDAEIGEKVPEK
jgi:hypothetical protein